VAPIDVSTPLAIRNGSFISAMTFLCEPLLVNQKRTQIVEGVGERAGTRTQNPLIKRPHFTRYASPKA
jgi:hypothetical protein